MSERVNINNMQAEIFHAVRKATERYIEMTDRYPPGWEDALFIDLLLMPPYNNYLDTLAALKANIRIAKRNLKLVERELAIFNKRYKKEKK